MPGWRSCALLGRRSNEPFWSIELCSLPPTGPRKDYFLSPGPQLPAPAAQPAILPLFYFILCIWVFCLRVYLYYLSGNGTHRDQKRLSEPLGQESQVMNHHVRAQTQTSSLQKSSRCWELLSLLPYLSLLLTSQPSCTPSMISSILPGMSMCLPGPTLTSVLLKVRTWGSLTQCWLPLPTGCCHV